jgi:hypothetical protein
LAQSKPARFVAEELDSQDGIAMTMVLKMELQLSTCCAPSAD